MAKTGAERQAKYKKIHGRINMVVSVAAVTKLRELAILRGLPQNQILEQLIITAGVAEMSPSIIAEVAADALLSNAAEAAEMLLNDAADVAEVLLRNAADNSMALRTNIAEVAAEAAEVAAAVLRRNAVDVALDAAENIVSRKPK